MDARFSPSGGDILPVSPPHNPVEQYPSAINTSLEGAPDALPSGGYHAAYDPSQMVYMARFQAAAGPVYPQTGMYDTFGYMDPAHIAVQALPGPVGQYAGLGTVPQNIVTTQTLVCNEWQVTSPPVVAEKTTRSTRGVEIACTNCRAVKKRCSQHTPCETCVKHGKADTCVRAEKKTRASRGGLPGQVEATQDTSFSAHYIPSPAVPQQDAVNPVLGLDSPGPQSQFVQPSHLPTSFDGAPHPTVNSPVDQGCGIVDAQYHPQNLSAAYTLCGAMNPPPGPSDANESWSWVGTSGPSDLPGGQNASAYANDSAAPANTLRFGSY